MPPSRKYVFNGRLKTLCDDSTLTTSRYYHKYLAIGALCYQGVSANGASILIPIQNEPVEAADPSNDEQETVVVEDDDQDGSSASSGDEAIEVDDAEALREEAAVGGSISTNKKASAKDTDVGYEKRYSVTIYLRDRQRLINPHVGMFVSAVVERAEMWQIVTADERATFRDYVYKVVYVKKWSSASTVDLKACFADAKNAMIADERRTRGADALVVSKFKKKSVAALALARSRGSHTPTFQVDDPKLTKAIASASLFAKMRLATLCEIGRSSRRFAPTVLLSFYNLYAQAQRAYHARLPASFTVDQLIGQLKLTACQAASVSCAELVSMKQIYDANYWHNLVFFAAIAPLEPHLYGSVIERWPGVQWYPMRDRAITAHMRKFIEKNIPPASDYVDPHDAALLAYKLHQEQQQWWRRDDDMFNVTELLTVVFCHNRAQFAVRPASILADAISLLLYVGAWRYVAPRTAQRMHLTYRGTKYAKASWMCTTRRYRLIEQLGRTALRVNPLLVREYGTGSYRGEYESAEASDGQTLCIYTSTRPTLSHQHSSSTATTLLSLDTILARERYYTNDLRIFSDFLAFDRIIVCDAHVLDAPTLLRLLRLCCLLVDDSDETIRFELRGDPVPTSSFRDFIDSRRFVVIDAVDGEGGDDERSVRATCVAIARSIKVQSARAAFHERLMKDNCTAVLANRRWLIVSGSNRDAGANAYPKIAEFYARLQQRGDDETSLAKHFLSLSSEPQRANEFVYLHSPFVGYRRQALRIAEFFVLQLPRGTFADRVTRENCLLLASDSYTQEISLDSPLLYLRLHAPPIDDDHRICCGTWARDVLHVACHRGELIGQSFVLARDALPLAVAVDTSSTGRASEETGVYFGNDYRFDDLYRVFVHAISGRHMMLNFDGAVLQAAMRRRYAAPNSFLIDWLIDEDWLNSVQ